MTTAQPMDSGDTPERRKAAWLKRQNTARILREVTTELDAAAIASESMTADQLRQLRTVLALERIGDLLDTLVDTLGELREKVSDIGGCTAPSADEIGREVGRNCGGCDPSAVCGFSRGAVAEAVDDPDAYL